MAIVKGDRIIRSDKLNNPLKGLGGRRLPKPAYWAYAHFVSILRDDFGRFRFSPRECLAKLAPERPDITEKDVSRLLLAYRDAGLVRTWEAGGVTWGEWTRAIVSSKWHGTPEPPWSKHEHERWCLSTALRQARMWSDPRAEELAIRIKALCAVKRTVSDTVGSLLSQAEETTGKSADGVANSHIDGQQQNQPVFANLSQVKVRSGTQQESTLEVSDLQTVAGGLSSSPSSPSSPSATTPLTDNNPPNPPSVEGGDLEKSETALANLQTDQAVRIIATAVRRRFKITEPLAPERLRLIRAALKSARPQELLSSLKETPDQQWPPWLLTKADIERRRKMFA